MYYINKDKKKVVGRNNQAVSPILIDFNTLGSVSFQAIDSNNKLLNIPSAAYYIAGGLKGTTVFYSNTFGIASGILTFVVDTYTEPFLDKIKKKYTEIDIEIGSSTSGTKSLLLRDIALANPRVYIEGLPPAPLSSYYTKEETDALLNTKLNVNDPEFYGTLVGQGNIICNGTAIISGKLTNGYSCSAIGEYSHAEGNKTEAIGEYSHAEGTETRAEGNKSHTEGRKTVTKSAFAHAEGNETSAIAMGSHVEGWGTLANYEYQHVAGKYNVPENKAYIIGGGLSENDRRNIFTVNWYGDVVCRNINSDSGTANIFKVVSNNIQTGTAIISGKLTNGYSCSTNSNYSHAEGYQTYVSGAYSHAEGDSTNANGNSSHAEGLSTVVFGLGAHAQGDRSVAYAAGSHVEGLGTQTWPATNRTNKNASYSFQHIEGKWNSTKEEDLKAFQYVVGGGSGPTDRKTIYKRDWNGNVWTSGIVSAAHFYDTTLGKIISGIGGDLTVDNVVINGKLTNGNNCQTVSDYSHAEGYNTKVNGQYSHAEGTKTNAKGFAAHAEGDSTSSNAYCSHSEGCGTIAGYNYQHVAGKYNESVNKAYIIGCGSSNNDRKNIFTVDWNGNVYASGTISGSCFYDTSTSSYIGAGGVTSTYVIDTVSAATSGKADKSQLNNYLTKNDPTFTGDIRSADNRFVVGEYSLLFGKNLDQTGSDQTKALVLGDYNDSETQDKVLVVGNGYYEYGEEQPEVRENSLQIDKTGNIWAAGLIIASDFRKGSISLVQLNYSNKYVGSSTATLNFLSCDTIYLAFTNASYINCSFTATNIRQNTIALVKYSNTVAARTLSFGEGGNVICAGVGTWLIGLININNRVNLVGNPVELK